MIRKISLTRLTFGLLLLVSLATYLYIPSRLTAAVFVPSLGSASGFGVLAGSAVTCTNGGGAVVNGDVGVWPGIAFTNSPPCTINGTVHSGDGFAKQAYLDFIKAYRRFPGESPGLRLHLPGEHARRGDAHARRLLSQRDCEDGHLDSRRRDSRRECCLDLPCRWRPHGHQLQCHHDQRRRSM